jgi:HK97 family phage portal protein
MGWFWQRQKPIELKSVSTPEMLMFMGRSSATFQNWDADVAIEQGLKASAIFFSCCRLRAEAIAQVPWVAMRKQGDELVKQPTSPLQRLIDSPNPDFTWAELTEMMSYHLDLAGNSFWSVIRAGNGSLPAEVWPQLPKGVQIYPGKERLIDGYKWSSGPRIASSEIIHVKTANPNNFLFGLPTIQAAGRAVDIDREAGDWQKNSLANRGVSDYAIVIDPNTSKESLDRLKAMHKERQAGPDNARQPFLTTRDIKPLNQTAVEMDFINSRMKVWQEICSAMGVPMPMVGILENATLANMETSRRVFWMDGIIPALRRIKSQLNQQLARDFGPDWVIDYDLSGVEALGEDYTKKLEQAQKLWGMGVPLAVINATLELNIKDIETVEGADVGYLQSTLLPVGFTGFDMGGEDNSKMLKALAYGRD